MKSDEMKRLKELEKENARLKKIVADQAVDISILQGGESGKTSEPGQQKSRRRARAMEGCLAVSERPCRVIGQPRSSQRYAGRKVEKNRCLAERMAGLSQENPRYGYRRVWALLRREGWKVNEKRVYRLWREEGLKMPNTQRERSRLP
jgi:hypothetical protein